MKNLLDNASVELACPHCARKFTQTAGKLKTNPTLTCPACSKPIAIKADGLRNQVTGIEKKAANLGKPLGRLGK